MSKLPTFAVLATLIAPYSFILATPATPVNDVFRSLVNLRSVDVEGKESYCTGFVVNGPVGLVLTADHCVAADGTIVIDGREGRTVKRDGWLALVQRSELGKPPLKIATKRSSILERVFSFGNAFDQGFVVLTRSVAGYGEKDHLVVDAPLAPGMSGGPIVNEVGEVVGINQMTTFATAIGCGFEEIRQFLGQR